MSNIKPGCADPATLGPGYYYEETYTRYMFRIHEDGTDSKMVRVSWIATNGFGHWTGPKFTDRTELRGDLKYIADTEQAAMAYLKLTQ